MRQGQIYHPRNGSFAPLEDCPFCYGKEWDLQEWDKTGTREKVELCEEIVTRLGSEYTLFYIFCHQCGAHGPAYAVGKDAFGRYHNADACKAAAVKAWNKRPQRPRSEAEPGPISTGSVSETDTIP